MALIKNEIRRWWVLNRLYHFVQKKGKNEWVKEIHFVAWMKGIDVTKATLSNKLTCVLFRPVSEIFYQIIAHLFFIHKRRDDFWNDVKTVLQELASDDIGWIFRQESTTDHTIGIKLTPKGKEKYALTSGITWFINNHKTLWVLIAGIIAWSPTLRPLVIIMLKYLRLITNVLL
jgi:hypothetical protein